MPDDIESDSPPETLVLSERPTFRWNEVPGASSYLVSLMDGSKICWEQKVRGTEVVYSGNAPLEQGVYYSLVIKSINDFSSESDLVKPDLKFNPPASGSVQRIESRINSVLKSQTVSFVFCPQGEDCITDEGQPGIWTYNPFTRKCRCRRVGGG